MTQKIMICGFPHSGTSILKSIIGHSNDVEEIYHETEKIYKNTNKRFIVCKCPFARDYFFEEEYHDYIKIFIVRNPLFVYSSLNKRFDYKLQDFVSFEKYVNILQKFIKYRNKPENNVYTIRYEDIFDDDFRALRNILNNIGVKYDESIFDNTKYKNIICPGIKLVDKKPNNLQHESYRTWQINQPFVSGNDVSKLDLSESQQNRIINNEHVLEIYPDIKSTFR
jgi:hypothetical protein